MTRIAAPNSSKSTLFAARLNSGVPEAQRILAFAESAGVPRWVTKLTAWEAALWRRVWEVVWGWADRR